MYFLDLLLFKKSIASFFKTIVYLNKMATEEIWDQFHDQLLSFIKSKVSNQEIAEDILQDVFIKIHTKQEGLKAKNKLTSWIYQITRNSIIDHYKKRKDYSSEVIDTPEALLISNPNIEFLNCLIPFVNKLPSPYQEAIRKTSLEGMSQKEYAAINNLSYSAAKSRVQRGREKLKKLFVNCCDLKSDKYGNIISDKKDDCNC